MAAVERGSTGGGFGAAKSSDSLIFGLVGSAGSTVAGATATGSSSAGAVPTSTVGSAGGGDTGTTGSTGSSAGAVGSVWATGSGAAAGVLISATGSVGGAVAEVSPEPHPTSRAAHAHEIGKNLMRRKSTRRLFKSRLYLQKKQYPAKTYGLSAGLIADGRFVIVTGRPTAGQTDGAAIEAATTAAQVTHRSL